MNMLASPRDSRPGLVGGGGQDRTGGWVGGWARTQPGGASASLPSLFATAAVAAAAGLVIAHDRATSDQPERGSGMNENECTGRGSGIGGHTTGLTILDLAVHAQRRQRNARLAGLRMWHTAWCAYVRHGGQTQRWKKGDGGTNHNGQSTLPATPWPAALHHSLPHPGLLHYTTHHQGACNTCLLWGAAGVLQGCCRGALQCMRTTAAVKL
jgi:hypothetical protein